jgi:hypothetical protein
MANATAPHPARITFKGDPEGDFTMVVESVQVVQVPFAGIHCTFGDGFAYTFPHSVIRKVVAL